MPQDLLRHTLATLAYRASKALRGAPADFGTFRIAPGTGTPGEILAHLGDLLDWGIALSDGVHRWHDSAPQAWDADVDRFFARLQAWDDRLASTDGLGFPAERLFQGPVADAFTHVGQIALLRRLAASPVRGENYFKADIAAGRAGREQARSKVEFD